MRQFKLDHSGHVSYDFWMASSILLWVVFYLVVRSVSLANGGHALAWDLGWYAEIAKNGYTFNGNPNQPQVVAFLPLYPFVLNLFLRMGVEIELALVAAPILLSSVGLWLIYKALTHLIPVSDAFLLMLLFVVSPFSIYFLNGYSECLYVCLFGAFLYGMIVKKSLFAAAIAAGMATAVRPHAVVLFAVYWVWEFDRHPCVGASRRRLISRIALSAPIFVLGFFLTCEYYYFAFGDLFLYKNIMIAWGFDELSDGAGGVVDHLRSQVRYLLVPDLRGLASGFAPEIAKFQLWVFALLLLLLGRRLPRVLLVYGLMVVAFSLLATISSVNLGRHMATNLALPALLVVLANSVLGTEVRDEVRRQGQIFCWIRYSLICCFLLACLYVQAIFINRFFMLQWVS